MARERFPGTPDDLSEVLGKFAEKDGKSFIRYPSEGNVRDAKTDVDSVLKNKELIQG